MPHNWEHTEEMPVSRRFLLEILGFIPHHLFMMRVRGDSMLPSIRPQDVIFVNYKPEQIEPGIYVLSVNGLVLVKRLGLKDPRTYMIMSDNKDYQDFDVAMDDICWGAAVPDVEVRVIGKVIGHIRLDS
ncbi:S24 family peptidase [Aristophania vespae]